jgi:hypothetical protein
MEEQAALSPLIKRSGEPITGKKKKRNDPVLDFVESLLCILHCINGNGK